MVGKILVALDGSSHAEAALDFATDVAARCQAALCLQHVITPRAAKAAARTVRFETLPPALRRRIRDAGPRDPDVRAAIGREILARAERRALGMGIRPVLTQLSDGDPAQQILAYADQQGVDLLVSGSRGLGLVREVFIGSVASKLQQLAKCPYCMVKLPHEGTLFGRLQDLT